jgi:hypothetical protein
MRDVMPGTCSSAHELEVDRVGDGAAAVGVRMKVLSVVVSKP